MTRKSAAIGMPLVNLLKIAALHCSAMCFMTLTKKFKTIKGFQIDLSIHAKKGPYKSSETPFKIIKAVE